jgi:hypothetical protein
MGRIRKFATAAVLAGVMAVAFGTTAQAASKKPPKDTGTVCSYLTSIITYEYVTPTVLSYALSLYDYYDCAAQ